MGRWLLVAQTGGERPREGSRGGERGREGGEREREEVGRVCRGAVRPVTLGPIRNNGRLT